LAGSSPAETRRPSENRPAIDQTTGDLGYTCLVVESKTNDGSSAADPSHEADSAEVSPAVERPVGRTCRLSGVVVRGFGRGRELGFPTANLELSHELQLPNNGIYAAWAHVRDGRYMAALSVGVNPTFEHSRQSVEAYLLDFDEDIYGQTMVLEIVERLRDEVRFEGVGPLVAQIQRDVDQARAVLEDNVEGS
jgi:riboflavin kinase/FMN adenylyltransferase